MLISEVPREEVGVSSTIVDEIHGGKEICVLDARRLEIPIECVQLGSRITTTNPVAYDYDYSLPDPELSSWVKVSLMLERTNGAITYMDLLRPLAWVTRYQLRVGADLRMHLPELEFNGRGRVTGIDFCPAIAEGDGSVVIGRMVTYNASELARVTFAGGVELCGTLHHPVWSLDREMWVGLSELEEGERVSCECVSGDGSSGLNGEHGGYVTGEHSGCNSGIAVVEEVLLYTTSEPVYNLETHGEHVYQVTSSGVLVHNAGNGPGCGGSKGDGGKSPTGNEVPAGPARKAAPNKFWKSSNTWDTAKNSKLLRENMGDAIKAGEDAHHIVPSTHGRAEAARRLLDKYQIDINDAVNGVGLKPSGPKPAHHGHGLHSHNAIRRVTERLKDVEKGASDWASKRQALLDELAKLKGEIAGGQFP